MLGLLLYAPQGEQMAMHNWSVYAAMNHPDQASHKKIIQKLPVPLYPTQSHLAYINDRIRDTMAAPELDREGVGRRKICAAVLWAIMSANCRSRDTVLLRSTTAISSPVAL